MVPPNETPATSSQHGLGQRLEQQPGHRAGFGYKRTPSVGGVSPLAAGGVSDDSDLVATQSRHEFVPVRHEHEHGSEEDEGESDEEVDAEERIQQRLTRQSTLSRAYTKQEEREVIRILDRRLVLFLAGLYLLSFLDRSNIGNARIAGLEESLSMTTNPAQFEWCLMAFYITYITFEWMILLYRVVPPHVYISGCVLAWGLVASCQSMVTSFGQLVVLRALLGVAEAAFGPGVPFYMTFFYRRDELAYRVGLQISAAPLATSFASSLAWLIVQGAGFVGLEKWRALFLVEGFPSVVAAVVAWYWIPDSPSTAPWLTPRQRKIATLRLQSESSSVFSRSMGAAVAGSSSGSGVGSDSWIDKLRSKLDLSELWRTLLDPKSYLTALMFLSVNVSFASLPVFLPTIINSMSFSPLTSQILSAPPYLVAFFFVMLVGRYSDKRSDSRSTCLCGVALLSCLSYTTIAVAGLLHDFLGDRVSITIRYVAVYPAAMGLFSSVVLIITWTLNNQQSSTGKGMGMVILNVIGQCGPLIGVELFPKSSQPLYVSGMAVCAGFMGGVACLALVFRRYLIRLNARNGEHAKGSYEMVGLSNMNHVDHDDKGDDDENEMQDTSGMEDDDDDDDEDSMVGKNGVRSERQFRFML